MRGYRIAFSLTGPSAVPSDIFGDLRAYQQSVIASRRKSVSRPSSKDYRFGPITVDWIDLDIPDQPTTDSRSPMSASGSTGRVPAWSNQQLNAEFIPSKRSGNAVMSFGTATLSEGIIRLFRENPSTLDDDPNNFVAQDDGTMLAVLAVPNYMTPADYLTFVAPAEEGLAHLRLVRDVSENRAVALMKFRTQEYAEEFAQAYNGREFNSIEPETCHVARITTISIDKNDNVASGLLQTPTKGMTDVYELPTCPVCLERMDSAVTGLVTVPCSHSFHCQCLSKWGDSRCPVCRYSQALLTSHPRSSGTSRTIPFASSSGSSSLSTCSCCASTTNLWICLICGNIGCGRYGQAHAHQHYTQTTHLYALELETQRVWDYAGDGYVHRLIQNRADGKLVELPSASAMTPSFTTLNGAANGTPSSSSNAHRTGPSAADALAAEKVEAIGIEYSYLLTSQLDSQRAYYEESQARYIRDLAEARERLAVLETEAVEQTRALKVDADKALEERALKAEAKAERSLQLARRFEKDLKEERAVSEGLMETIASLKAKSERGEQERIMLREDLQDVKDQLRDLMFHLQAGEKLQGVGGGGGPEGAMGEAAGGSLSVVTTEPASTPGSKKKPKKKK